MEETKNCCCQRKTDRSEEEKRKLINRLSRIEGQIRGIKSMVENDAYCADILTQSSAVSSAIHSFNSDLLARHIRTCVSDDLKNGREGAAEELTALIQKLMK